MNANAILLKTFVHLLKVEGLVPLILKYRYDLVAFNREPLDPAELVLVGAGDGHASREE
jgi:hypothetical protein